ncbi:hypothetical protein TRIUR3_30137 [Triticum urartu]|uniref:Uncharacterized protein n=1 Tax=Triticum urartu TaxID=4572 RepID=M8AKQ2_TRIUA|nr:hypothetical protein TRIUR3_30137 [Triticum urartu]
MVVVHRNHGQTWRVIGSRSRVFGDGCGTHSVEVRAAVVVHSVEEELDESESFGVDGSGTRDGSGTCRFRYMVLQRSRSCWFWWSKTKKHKGPRVTSDEEQKPTEKPGCRGVPSSVVNHVLGSKTEAMSKWPKETNRKRRQQGCGPGASGAHHCGRRYEGAATTCCKVADASFQGVGLWGDEEEAGRCVGVKERQRHEGAGGWPGCMEWRRSPEARTRGRGRGDRRGRSRVATAAGLAPQ